MGISDELGFGVAFTLKDNFSAAADKISAKFTQLEGITENATQKINIGLNRMQLGFASIGIGAIGLAGIGFATKKAADFEEQLSKVKAVSGATAEEMDTFRKLSLKSGQDIGYSAVESAKAIEELVKAGVSMKDIMGGGLRGALSMAAAGEMSVGEAAETASTALNAFHKDHLSISRAADILAGAANASATDLQGMRVGLSMVSAISSGAGLSLLDTSTALAVLAQNGLKGSDAGTSLKTMLNNLQPITKQETALFKQLGLVTKENNNLFYTQSGNIKTLAEISDVLNSKLSTLNNQQRSLVIKRIFGSDAQRAAQIFFEVGRKGFDDMSKAMQQFTAEQVAKEKLNNLIGALKQFRAKIEGLAITIGSNFLMPFRGIVNVLNSFLNIINKISASAFGKYLWYTVGAISALFIGFGLVNVATGIYSFVIGQAATATAKLGLTQVATTFITGGLTAGLYALATAAWAALSPMLPIILGIGAIVGAVVIAVKAFNDFESFLDSSSKKASGLGLIMQQIGGVLFAVAEIWQNTTMMGSSMSENLHNKLKDLGILDFVLTLSTWVMRIKMIFDGFASVISFFWGIIKNTFLWIKEKVISILNTFGINISKLGGNFSTFKIIGQALAVVITAMLLPALLGLVGTFISIALPIIAVIAGIWLLWQALKYLGEGVMWVVNKFLNLLDIVVEIGKSWWNVGVNIIENVWEGIKSIWGSFSEWITNLFASLWETIKNAFDFTQWFGDGNNVSMNQNIMHTSTQQLAQLNTAPAVASYSNNQQPIVNVNNQQPVVNTKVYLDSYEIAKSVQQQTELNNARR